MSAQRVEVGVVLDPSMLQLMTSVRQDAFEQVERPIGIT
jgi:hypothetical protein